MNENRPNIDELCRAAAEAVLDDMGYLPEDRQNPSATVCFDESKENYVMVCGNSGCQTENFRRLFEERPELCSVVRHVLDRMYKKADW